MTHPGSTPMANATDEIHVYAAGKHRIRIVDRHHTWILDIPRAWPVMNRCQRLTWIGHMIDTVEPAARAA